MHNQLDKIVHLLSVSQQVIQGYKDESNLLKQQISQMLNQVENDKSEEQIGPSLQEIGKMYLDEFHKLQEENIELQQELAQINSQKDDMNGELLSAVDRIEKLEHKIKQK